MPLTEQTFDSELCRQQGYLAKALIWLGEDTFRWCKVVVRQGPNEHGQYMVERLRNGWYAATDRIRNLTPDECREALNLE